MSPSRQRLRSKAKVTVVEHASATQSTLHSDGKVSHAGKEDGPFSLPDGWIVETKIRKGGKSSGASYKIYINSVTGFKCYSMKEVNRYVTGGQLSAPIPGTKKRATLNSPDSVLMKNGHSSMEQPSPSKNASRKKKAESPVVAATQNQSLKRSLFESSTFNISGKDSSNVSPARNSHVSHKAGGKVRAPKIKNVSGDLQDVYTEQSQEEADDIAGDILESIDKIISNLSQDLKIPDISIACGTHLELGEFDLRDQNEAGYNSSLMVKHSTKQLGFQCSESKTPCELRKVETNSAYLLLRKTRRETEQNSASTNEKEELNGKSYSDSVEVVNEISVDMVPENTDEVPNRKLLLPDNDGSVRKRRHSRLEHKAAIGKQSEPNSVNPSLPKNKGSRLEEDTKRLEETTTKLNRTNKERSASSHPPITPDNKDNSKTAITSVSARTSRRLAGRDAGADSHADINQNDLRRNKRLRK